MEDAIEHMLAYSHTDKHTHTHLGNATTLVQGKIKINE